MSTSYMRAMPDTGLFDTQGTPLVLTSEVGAGGEGTIYDVRGRPSQVAKVYNHQHLPDEAKEAKLTFMAENAEGDLLQWVAWPVSVVRSGGMAGPIVGFLMPKLFGHHPIHEIYSPAHRRQERPKDGWDFLLEVARNLACAFEAVHARGHVLGDVNQGNILVADDRQVKLIDCDSFQIDAKGTLHPCEVGVAHFVPPELQGAAFSVRRTENQDNFGLAVLIFHLLFGGRHPFSGVPLVEGAGDSLEADIKAYRYAYARDHRRRGLAPPPRSVPVTLVPEDVEAMFQKAFTDKTGNRPGAGQWVMALDALLTRLTRCSFITNHVYPQHLKSCPWCELDRQGTMYFLDLEGYTRTQTGFVLSKVWEIIERIAPPPPLKVPKPEDYPVEPSPAPAQKKHNRTIHSVRFLSVAATIAVLVTNPELWIPAGVLGLGGAAAAGRIGRKDREDERADRWFALVLAERAYQEIRGRLEAEAGVGGFRAKFADLERLRDEYLALPKIEKAEIEKLHLNAHERQLEVFLEGFYIEDSTINGIGTHLKSKLRSFGIETAADVRREEVEQTPGIGPSRTAALLQWRADCEGRFRFESRKAVSENDKNLVRARCAARKLQLEAALRGGIDDLQKIRAHSTARAEELQPDAVRAARRVAQARADYQEVV